MMKPYFLLLVLPLLLSCGNRGERTVLPLEIDVALPTSSDTKVKEAFLQNVSKYQLIFTGKFGKRRAELLSKNDGSKYLVENIPFDPALRISVEIIGKGWSHLEKKWVENQILAIGETSESVNWGEGKTESIKIICNLTQVGEDTHEEIFNVHDGR